METVGWYFPVLLGGGEEGYTSNDIEAFKGEELYVNLTRETCQNSLDAKEPDAEGPVIVKYDLREFDTASYPFFTDYKECVESCERYWQERPDPIPERLENLLAKSRKALDASKVFALVVSDYNTPGLLGSQTTPLSGSFNALVYAPGVSYKESDTSAGSFGIGRNAPFACSDLSCVCYNTKAKDGGEAFAGVAKLATMWNGDEKPTRNQGRYQHNDEENERWRPIRPDDEDEFASLFHRDEYGTDVIIFGFDAAEDWEKQLEAAVLKNFFLAIHERKLVVEIQGKRIDADTIPALFREFEDGNVNDREIRLAHQYYKAIKDPNSVRCGLSILSDNDAELIIRTDPEIDMLKSVAWFRSSGMLIRPFKPQGVFRPYVAVFVAKGELDRVLRDTEPARHNDWDYKRIEKGTNERILAKKAVDGLKREIKAKLKSACESVVDDTVDAVGAADYLPDNLDGGSREGGGTDVMRPIVRIGKSRRSVLSEPVEKVRGKKASGENAPGSVGNRRKNPTPDPNAEPTVPVSNTGDVQGVTQGKGGKVIERPISGKRRLFALAPDQGLYRLVISPDVSAENVTATCMVLGENGTSEPIKAKTAMLDGRRLGITPDGAAIGPFNVTKGERAVLAITFEELGSMALSVDLKAKGVSA